MSVISTATAKEFLRISHNKEDAVIRILVESAQEWLCEYLGLRMTVAAPASITEYVNGGAENLWPKWHPIVDVTRVEDRLTGSVMSSTLYEFCDRKIWLSYGGVWFPGQHNWKVNYKAGIEEADCPAAVKETILQLVFRAYNKRGGAESQSSAGESVSFDGLLTSDEIARVAMYQYRQSFG